MIPNPGRLSSFSEKSRGAGGKGAEGKGAEGKEEKRLKMIKGCLRADLAMKLSQERHPAFNACRSSSELTSR